VNDSVKVVLGAVRGEAKGQRDAFNMDQLKALLRAASGSDWEGAVIAGFYTGLRLRDVAELTW
jgi:hypothetical protein